MIKSKSTRCCAICYPVVALHVVQLTLHAVHDDAPVTEYVLGEQFAHVAVPPAEKVPALHGTHAADEVNPLPGGQVVQALFAKSRKMKK